MLTRPLNAFDSQFQVLLWVVTLCLILVVGVIDYSTGYEISAVLFYSAPIFLMVRFGDKESSVLTAIFCSIVWWWADEAAGHRYSQPWHEIWETIVRLIYFLLFVLGGSALKARIELLERSRHLEQEIIRISEREQRRIGQDLHDGICQHYAAVGCAAGSLKARLQERGAGEVGAAAEIESLIMDGVVQTRNLARGLFPVEKDERGLPSALEELAAGASRLTGLECEFQGDTDLPPLDNAAATHLFRIAQEALNNATRHGKSTRVAIQLGAQSELVTLVVTDNGIGLPEPLPLPRGMGLSIMQYRARVLGGQFSIAPNPTGGTVVSCVFPADRVTTKIL